MCRGSGVSSTSRTKGTAWAQASTSVIQRNTAALLHKNGDYSFIHADRIELPPESPEEQQYQAMWRTFYDTIGIEGRRNETCRRTHMPKRYWRELTEMQQGHAGLN